MASLSSPLVPLYAHMPFVAFLSHHPRFLLVAAINHLTSLPLTPPRIPPIRVALAMWSVQVRHFLSSHCCPTLFPFCLRGFWIACVTPLWISTGSFLGSQAPIRLSITTCSDCPPPDPYLSHSVRYVGSVRTVPSYFFVYGQRLFTLVLVTGGRFPLDSNTFPHIVRPLCYLASCTVSTSFVSPITFPF